MIPILAVNRGKTHGNVPGKGGQSPARLVLLAAAGAWKTSQGLCLLQRLPRIPGRAGSSPRSPQLSPSPALIAAAPKRLHERQSPNCRCQTAGKGVDVTAPLPGMTQPPSPRELLDLEAFSSPESDPSHFFLVVRGVQEPPAQPGRCLLRGTGEFKQLRGLIKGLGLDTGQAECTAWDGNCPGAREGIPGGLGMLGTLCHRGTAPSRSLCLFSHPPGAAGEVLNPGQHPWVPFCSAIPALRGPPAPGSHGSCFLL